MPSQICENFIGAMRKNAAQSYADEVEGRGNLIFVRTKKIPTLYFYMKFMMMRPRLKRIKPRRIIMSSIMPLMVWL